MDAILKQIEALSSLSIEEKVGAYNRIVEAAHEMLGFGQNHPCLKPRLIKSEQVESNSYNPNRVAPPEFELLKLSIERDGLTMPLVVNTSPDGPATIVDGYHRSIICKASEDVSSSLEGYVPCSVLDRAIDDRMASTVRHNMARGNHQTTLSSELIILLKKYNWSDRKIGKELGMEPDEILRLKQIIGIAEVFADEEFSQSWTV